jgi:hypothetical protein
VREFRTAPAGRSARTKASDSALERLASKFGLSDMTNRDGSVGGSRKAKPDFKPIWGEMPKGNVYEVGRGERAADVKGALIQGGGAVGAMASMGMNSDVDAAMVQKYGPDVKERLARAAGIPVAEPKFMDVAKHLPKPRPNPQGREPGSANDLGKAMEQAPVE